MKRLGEQILWSAVMAVAIVANGRAGAAIVFEQPRNTIGNPAGWNSNGPDAFPTVPLLTSTQTADDFELSLLDPISLTRISWFGQYVAVGPPDLQVREFVLRLFANDGSAPKRRPGAMFLEQRSAVAGVDTGRATAVGNRILSYSLNLALPPVLAPNRTYWVSILENDPATSNIWRWSHGGTGIGRFGAEGDFAQRLTEFYPWNQIGPLIGRNLAFSLEGVAVPAGVPVAVPVPAPVAPLAVSLVLLAVLRRRHTGRLAGT